jgi:glucose/mannose-6-phosphate isomerase
LILSQETYNKLDPSDMRGTIRGFFEQVEEAVVIGQKSKIPTTGKNVTNIVLAGMGGSAIGADLLRTYLSKQLRVPFFVNRHYKLPSFVDKNSLVIISSYSGNTEETLEAYEDAITRKANVLCISSGGEVSKKAKDLNHPFILIPGGLQPRAALGYSFFPLLYAIEKMGFIEIDDEEVNETITVLKTLSGEAIDISEKNLPYSFAKQLYNSIVVIWSSSDLLEAVSARWRGQMNENAKNMAYSSNFPELNHNEIVGWENPESLLRSIAIVVLRDPDDHPRVQQRISITKDILKNIPHSFIEINPRGQSRLARMFSTIHLGDWISFYLAILNEMDPTPVERIGYLKNELDRVR